LRKNETVKRYGNTMLNVVLVVAAVAFPVLVVVLAIQGDWAPAAVVAVALCMTWWRGRHNGRYIPEPVRSWVASRRRA
jgi:hypothetical protein